MDFIRPLPRLTPHRTIREDDIGKIDAGELQAELYGCPTRFIYLAKADYQTSESYLIHKFRSLQLKHLNNNLETILEKAQYDNVPRFLDSVFNEEERGFVTIINSYPDLEEGMLFFWHLICHAGVLRLKDPLRKKLSFGYVGTPTFEDCPYTVQPNHLLAFGPCIDEFEKRDIVKTVAFVSRFIDYNRILFLSVSNVCTFLERARIAPANVKYYFNLFQKPDDKKKRTASKNAKLIEM